MAKIAVVVAAYNIDSYIERCIESLKNQSYDKFEVIVVDDASTDETVAKIKSSIKGDKRFTLVQHEKNQGLHLARATGVAYVKAPWLLFLDGDDELAPDMLEQLAAHAKKKAADLIHYGITVIAESGVTDDMACSFASYINTASEAQTNEMVLAEMCDQRLGYKIDWRATQRLMKTELVKEAFKQMTHERLERAEDGYEMFVICANAKSSCGYEDIRGYLYHYGIGVTGASKLRPQDYAKHCAQFADCLAATRAWCDEHPSEVHERAYEGMRRKMLELSANDLIERVPRRSWKTAAKHFAAVHGNAAACAEFWRFARDRAWDFFANGKSPSEDDVLYDFMAIAQSLEKEGLDVSDDALRAHSEKVRAQAHFGYSMRHAKLDNLDNKIRIFVATHKRVDFPESTIFHPIQVGAALAPEHFFETLHDDTGDNISLKNASYCEMCAQWWAWKNVDADYVGFAHYRRYFNFSSKNYPENPFGEVIDDYIDEEAARLYGLDDDSIRACIDGFDLITTGFKTLADFPGEFTTPREHYAQAPALHIADLELMAQIVKREHPDYAQDVDAFLEGTRSCFCNMYIMRKPLFDSYCEWVFPLLDAFVEECDMSRYGQEALRTPGHLAERLFNIWYLHLMRTQAQLKTKELQCVHFKRPEHHFPLMSALPRVPHATLNTLIPIVFASDNSYVPMVTTTITSILQNASTDVFFDFVILTKDISPENQQLMLSCIESERAQLRFVWVANEIEKYKLTTNNAHISNETYYRFLVQDLLPFYDKVLYLDSDLIAEADVVELFSQDLGDCALGAVIDIDYLANLNLDATERREYVDRVLKMKDPYAYFQAGVLLLNTRVMRELHSVSEWLEIASRGDFIYDDQDILNMECEGRVLYLDPSWNVMHNCFERVQKLFMHAPLEVYKAYLSSRENPKIIHYAGSEKPWTHASCDYAERFWPYARQTPFYEELLCRAAHSEEQPRIDSLAHELEDVGKIARRTDFGRMVDALAPEDTKRRQVMRKIARSIIK